MSLQYVLCFRFLPVDFEKRKPEGLGKKELQQRAEFYVLNESCEEEIFYFLSFSSNMSDRTRIDCNSEVVVKIISHLLSWWRISKAGLCYRKHEMFDFLSELVHSFHLFNSWYIFCWPRSPKFQHLVPPKVVLPCKVIMLVNVCLHSCFHDRWVLTVPSAAFRTSQILSGTFLSEPLSY